MEFKNILFSQVDKNKLSDYQIIDFCNTLLSINYKIELINGFSSQFFLKNHIFSNEGYTIFSNPKKKHFENYKVNLKNEVFSEMIISNGNFSSIYPNTFISDLEIITNFFSFFRKIFYDIDNEFKRDWTLNNAIKLYIQASEFSENEFSETFYDKGFAKSIDFLELFFKEQAIKYEIPHIIKLIETKKLESKQKRNDYSKIIREFYNENGEFTKTYKDYILNVFKLISINDFPQIYHIDFDTISLSNFSFNDFITYDSFSIQSISHESPWNIKAILAKSSVIYTYYLGFITLENYRFNIKKNKKDIEKTDIELLDKRNNKLMKLIDEIKKSNSDLKTIYENIDLINDPIVKTELLSIFENCIYELNKIIKKYNLLILLDDIKTSI